MSEEGSKQFFGLHPAGGVREDIGLVWEPIGNFGYVYNWSGLTGITTAKKKPKSNRWYFPIQGNEFYLTGKALDTVTFYTPDEQMVKAWANDRRESLDADEIWRRIMEYYKIFIDLPDESYYTALGLGIFQSWLQELLHAVFYITVYGQFGGGKTATAEATIRLMKHGHSVGNPSIAFIGRSLDREKLSIFIDEVDSLAGEQDNPMYQILRVGYREGASYDRINPTTMESESWSVYGAKVLTIHGGIEKALESRSIPITVKETNSVEVPIINQVKSKFGGKIASELFLWYMDNIMDISKKLTEKLMNKEKVDIVNIVSPKVREKKNSGQGVDRLRSEIFDRCTTLLKEGQLGQLKKLRGRNIELAYSMFKISNLIGVDVDDEIVRLFSVKQELEEEAREVGLTGKYRNFLKEIYTERAQYENYWTRSGEFMISNKELYSRFNEKIKEERMGISPARNKELLRELGFSRPDSRKKMKIYTWDEIEKAEKKLSAGHELDELSEKPVRLANIYSPRVQRNIGVEIEKPDEVNQVGEQTQLEGEVNLGTEEVEDGDFDGNTNHHLKVTTELQGTDGLQFEELNDRMEEKDRFELRDVLDDLMRDGKVHEPREDFFKLTK